MPHFKDSNDNIFFLSDADVLAGWVSRLPAGSQLISDAEADALRSAEAPTSDVVEVRRFSSLEFLDLFAEIEQLAIVEASMQSAPIKLWYDRTLAASFVTVDDPRVSAGLTALVAAGLLTEQRKGEILAAMSS